MFEITHLTGNFERFIFEYKYILMHKQNRSLQKYGQESSGLMAFLRLNEKF